VAGVTQEATMANKGKAKVEATKGDASPKNPATDALVSEIPPTTDDEQESAASGVQEAQQSTAAKGDIAALWIRSVKPEGFRRCGFRFGPEGVGIALDALTDDQVEILSNDPNLVVEPTWVEAEAVN
jgi:hypothetical protein